LAAWADAVTSTVLSCRHDRAPVARKYTDTVPLCPDPIERSCAVASFPLTVQSDPFQPQRQSALSPQVSACSPEGRSMVAVTSRAVPGPEFVTVSVQLPLFPARTDDGQVSELLSDAVGCVYPEPPPCRYPLPPCRGGKRRGLRP
jgi:hypothetical protein